MKKRWLVAFCLLTLCNLLVINAGTIKASEPGYVRIDYPTQVPPTIDGAWTSSDEWTDGEVTMIGEDVAFRSTWDSATEGVYTRFIVEFYSDNTTDAGDYWQMCTDYDASGGSAPGNDDFRIDIEGHNNLTVYQGTGSGWTPITPDPSDITWANSLSASPTNSTPHWILEMEILKNAGIVQLYMIWGLRLAVFDANSTAGVLSWPPTSRDVPDGWGVQNFTSDPIPEGFSLGVVVLLSSAAVAVGFYCLRKRSRPDKYGLGKLGK